MILDDFTLKSCCEEGSSGVAGRAGRLPEAPSPGQGYNLGVKKVVQISQEKQEDFLRLQVHKDFLRLQAQDKATTWV